MKIDEIRTFLEQYGEDEQIEGYLEELRQMTDAELETSMRRIALHILVERMALRKTVYYLEQWGVLSFLPENVFSDSLVQKIIHDVLDSEKGQQFIDLVARRDIEIELMEPEERAEEEKRLARIMGEFIDEGT